MSINHIHNKQQHQVIVGGFQGNGVFSLVYRLCNNQFQDSFSVQNYNSIKLCYSDTIEGYTDQQSIRVLFSDSCDGPMYLFSRIHTLDNPKVLILPISLQLSLDTIEYTIELFQHYSSPSNTTIPTIITLTQSDLFPPEKLDLVVRHIESYLRMIQFPYNVFKVIAVSSKLGTNIKELKDYISQAIHHYDMIIQKNESCKKCCIVQ